MGLNTAPENYKPINTLFLPIKVIKWIFLLKDGKNNDIKYTAQTKYNWLEGQN